MNRIKLFALSAFMLATAHAEETTIEMHTVNTDGVGTAIGTGSHTALTGER